MKKTEEKYLMNRELSWLKFNDRVLDEAGNPRVPLAERLTFAAYLSVESGGILYGPVGTLWIRWSQMKWYGKIRPI